MHTVRSKTLITLPSIEAVEMNLFTFFCAPEVNEYEMNLHSHDTHMYISRLVYSSLHFEWLEVCEFISHLSLINGCNFFYQMEIIRII